MNFFRVFLFCVLIGLTLETTGCSTRSPEVSTNTIVEKYTKDYIKTSNIDKDTDNHDIAAMLQTLTVDLIKHPSETWEEVNVREDRYVNMVKTNYISSVYTIFACDNEIRIFDGFCDEIIYYYSVIESDYAHFSGQFLGNAATRFIVNMGDYEYTR